MIRSCSQKEVQLLLDRKFSRKFQRIEKAARIRLELLDAAISLRDLELPGLRLEALNGDRKGQHVLAQPEMEIERFPLVRIPPFGRGFFKA